MTSPSPAAIWAQVTGVQPDPPRTLVIAAAAVALAVVAVPLTWRLSRNVVTIAHEGGHALAAVASGRRLTGIRLHSDTSGVTLSHGKPHGFGMVVTGAAGYITPSLLGLGAAAMLAAGRITALLWLALLLLAAMLVLIRNVYGVLSVVATGGGLFAVSWFTPADVQAAFAYLGAWFLLFAGVRPVVELQRLRRRGRAPHSDADQLGWLTGVPPLFWVGMFAAVTIAALMIGARLLLP